MTHHPSAEKRNRQRLGRTRRNKNVRSAVRTIVKKAREEMLKGDVQAAGEQVALASCALARAASKHILHKRVAARTTARMALQLHALSKA
jgi:small subunit ribosomal protein S20